MDFDKLYPETLAMVLAIPEREDDGTGHCVYCSIGKFCRDLLLRFAEFLLKVPGTEEFAARTGNTGENIVVLVALKLLEDMNPDVLPDLLLAMQIWENTGIRLPFIDTMLIDAMQSAEKDLPDLAFPNASIISLQ